jgi:hypothetical protein
MAQLNQGSVVSLAFINQLFRDSIRNVNEIPPAYLGKLNTGNFDKEILNTTTKQHLTDADDIKILTSKLINDIKNLSE